jgi:hypothetical protein
MAGLIATSVVRGSQQGDSHGGVFLIDLKGQKVEQKLDWNTMAIDWRGRGADRGLRGIAIHNETLFIAASDELYAYNPDFSFKRSWRNQYLKHCHEIVVYQNQIFLTSTGFDSILVFDIEKEKFHWGLYVETEGYQFTGSAFDPCNDDGPLMLNKLHINSITANDNGLYFAGLKTGGLLHFNGKRVNMSATLPPGTHNAQPYQDGVLFNDTNANMVRYASRDAAEDRAFKVPSIPDHHITGKNLDDSPIARASFGRGLCIVKEGLIATGSSPSTVALHDLKSGETVLQVTLSTDIRNAIHGLEVWNF